MERTLGILEQARRVVNDRGPPPCTAEGEPI
jgi:hypothetical protein